MMVVNLEQVRASNALKASRDETYCGKDGGEIAKKIPGIIRENGILGALAYSLEKGTKTENVNDGMKRIMDAVAVHLSDCRINRVPPDVKDAAKLLTHLVNESSSDELREQTSEAMAYLGYFRRFARKV